MSIITYGHYIFATVSDVTALAQASSGSAAWAKTTLTIGNVIWADWKVLVMSDFQDISKSMQQNVDGIVGPDTLKEFSVVFIDFKHHRLVLSR